MIKEFVKEHPKGIRTVRIVLASLLGLMIVVDIILVRLNGRGFPTFSAVIDRDQNEFIWFSFLYGGLLAKVFYNRKVKQKDREITGVIAFGSIVLLLYLLGQELNGHVPDLNMWHQLLLLLFGGYLAHRVWPQYER